MAKAPIRTSIDSDRQRYVDEPVYSETTARPLAESIASAYGRAIPRQIRNLDHYSRVPLRWMRPDGKGGLVKK